MQRSTPKERAEDIVVIMAEGELSFAEASRFRKVVLTAASELHRLYEKACNEPLAPYDERRTAYLEERLKTTFTAAGLGLYLNADPRGNPVGVLTPKTGRYNTMGGREAGWRL
jgi:hypothetical protein